MIDWLYGLPEPLLLAVSSAILVGLMVFLPALVRRLPGMAPNDANTDFVLRIQTTLFTMTSLVLTFTLVQADINFRQVDSLVSAEAARIEQFDRLLTRYGSAAAAMVRPLLRAYAQSIVNEEWPSMLSGDNGATGRTFAPISRRVLAISPAGGRESLIFAEMLKSLDAIAESRAARLNALSIGLPAIYWDVVLFAVAMLLFVSCAVERTAFRAIVLAAQAAVLGAFIGFVFVMDQPFKGQTAISPDTLVQVIARMERRTE
jgi:hypothetical protein